MNRLFISIIVSLICCHQAFAQGYRGKRFSVDYQTGYSMVEPSFDFGRIMMHHRFNLGFALSKHFSINLNGSYTNSRTFLNQDIDYASVQVKDITGGITVKYFYKNFQSFAPLGRYVGFGIDYGTQNTVRTEVVDLGPGYSLQYNDYYDDTKRSKLLIYSFFFGRNFLVKERLLLGWGIQYGLCSGDGPKFRHCIKPQFNLGFIF